MNYSGYNKNYKKLATMKVKEIGFSLYPEEYANQKEIFEDVENIEFSKKGLEKFYQKYKMYLIIYAYDGINETAFDKEGTFNINESGMGVDGTGPFRGYNRRNVSYERKISVVVDSPNVIDLINFFENNLDVKRLFPEKDEFGGYPQDIVDLES